MKNDIEAMKRMCASEIANIEKHGDTPAPFWFERVAILSRKEKNYKQEVEICEQYISLIDSFYASRNTTGMADARAAPTFKAIKKRLTKAKELYEKQQARG